jgi:hypothetical protein
MELTDGKPNKGGLLTMLDYQEYTIDGNSYQGNGNGHNGNGYDKLDGDWGLFYKVAKRFTYKVVREDSEDFLHDLFLTFARVKVGYQVKGKELTEGGLMRVAQYELAGYWRKYYKQINGIDCGQCSNKQRVKCKEWFLYGDNDCPKAIKTERLNKLVEDGNGDSTPLHELIADDKAVDLVAMLDARHTLKGYPTKAVKLAYKRYAGYPLDNKEKVYLSRFQKRLQKTLI